MLNALNILRRVLAGSPRAVCGWLRTGSINRDQIRIPNRGTDVPLLICGIVEIVNCDQFAVGTLHGPGVAQVPRPSISPQNDLAAPRLALIFTQPGANSVRF